MPSRGYRQRVHAPVARTDLDRPNGTATEALNPREVVDPPGQLVTADLDHLVAAPAEQVPVVVGRTAHAESRITPPAVHDVDLTAPDQPVQQAVDSHHAQVPPVRGGRVPYFSGCPKAVLLLENPQQRGLG